MSNSAFSQSAAPSSFADLTGPPTDNAALAAALAGKADAPAPTSYVEYVATLTQSGTSDPVATVQRNGLGGAIVWTYGSEGNYFGTLTGAFPDDKCVGWVGDNDFATNAGTQSQPRICRVDANTVRITSPDGDSALFGMPVIIQRIP